MRRLNIDPPIMNACGAGFNHLSTLQILDEEGILGALIPKSIGPEPRDGNTGPTNYREAAFELNAMGLPTQGVREFISEYMEFEYKFRMPLILSMYAHGKDFDDTIAQHVRMMALLNDLKPGGYEINRSCPNPMPGEKSLQQLAQEQDLRNEAELFKILHEKTDKPIIAKLSPKGDYVAMAKEIAPYVDYICCGNTYPGTIIHAATGYPVLSAGKGGISGPALRPINQLMILEVYQAVHDYGVGLIGCGGIGTPTHVIEVIRAGATYVQVGTAAARADQPVPFFKKLVDGTYSLAEKYGKSLKELVGDNHAPRS